MANFTNVEKMILDYFFTSSDENNIVYAAKQTLPQEIVGYIIGRASRAKDTFREIFLKLWSEAWDDSENPWGSVPVLIKQNSINKTLNKISDKAFKFLNEYKLHNSLRDVPHVAIFCDELSILQTKVWEHEVVAEYQEKSTRYREFIASNVYMPNNISNELKNKYNMGHEALIKVYNNIFEDTGKRDLARYLLPVASKTAMACMANLRAWERIVARMKAYPTLESKELALMISTNIRKVFNKEDSFEYNYRFYQESINTFSFLHDFDRDYISGFDRDQQAIVKSLDSENIYKINGLIDIGAHRDLQRHRSIIQNFPDYRPIYGYDKLISSYINSKLYMEYSACMGYFNQLFLETYYELRDKSNIGEIQYASLLGHMTKFWYVTDKERWQYVHDLRTGAPTQQSTNEKTVHFSYSNWCKIANKNILEIDEKNRGNEHYDMYD